MFKVTHNPEFTHDVPVQVPVDGGHLEQKLRTRFRMMDLDQIDAFDLSTKEGNTTFLQRVVIGFEDLVDEDNNRLECTDALRDRMLMQPHIRMGLTQAYNRAVYKARVGN
ncbi:MULTISPECIES: hypothetical protein [unclassified Yoonia]|uniref:hypothetical protein n=1 Tax=unclassified Yoonia TaxID=2629118 RepID=UPI002AFF8B07|nr:MULTISPECIES: hypothetical protein [unclassified Yoonia]